MNIVSIAKLDDAAAALSDFYFNADDFLSLTRRRR